MARKSSKPRKAKAPAAAGQTSESLAHPKPLGSISSTAEVPVSSHMIDQIIGQEKAVAVIRKAAAQKRNVLLVGSPGTGKSMLAQAMAELIPIEELQDVLIVYNPEDENVPKVKVVKAGDGRKIVQGEKMKNRIAGGNINVVIALFLMVSTGILLFVMPGMGIHVNLIAAMLVGLFVMGAAMMFASQVGRGRLLDVGESSKLLVDNSGKKKAPFIDATGAKAGALLGDVKHDPFQCIPADELVHLPSGKPVKISTVVEPLLDFQGERDLGESERFEVLAGSDSDLGYAPATVSRVFKRRYSGKLVRIITRRGQVISVTPNHPIAYLTGDGRIEYVQAELLDPEKHRCVLPRALPTYAETALPETFLLFLADILADGHISERSVNFKFKREFKVALVLGDIAAAGFSARTRVRGGATLIDVNSAALVKRLEQMGAKTPSGKAIPSALFAQTPSLIRSFVFRYLSLDGYVGKQGQFELLSRELISDFVPLLLRIGVVAKRRDRLDRGFKKGNLQPRIIFGDFTFAKEYASKTANPFHRKNLEVFLGTSSFKHVSFTDSLPVSFEFLEGIRVKTGLSKAKVHKAYYALNERLSTYSSPTRNFLGKVCASFLEVTNGPGLFRLRNAVQGTYAYDEVVKKEEVDYDGFVYNLTTSTGNYLVNCVLTHNSGGLGTPAHLRVEAGFVHKAHKGVLFIDEASTLRPKAQQELLTAMQERKYSITGQSEMSSGALVRSEPVPCDFVLVAAGNYADVVRMHPALRSRIRGYGYEVYMEETIDDTPLNRDKLAVFVAQEVAKDGKIPHFSKDAVEEIVLEARKRAGRKNKLTLRLRELGGLVRAAGDVARERKEKLVAKEHVLAAKRLSRTLEQQASQQSIDLRKDYQLFLSSGARTGRVNGLAVMGDAGVALPIVAEVAPASSKQEGRIIATGKLGKIAEEAVKNVSAIIKKHLGKDTSNYDIHIQFLQTYEGVEGDSASISVAAAVISALEGAPIRQDVAMTGSLSVRGDVLPVGGVTPKAEAALEAGIHRIIVPKANAQDIVLDRETGAKMEIIPVSTFFEVLQIALADSPKKALILSRVKKELN